MKKHGLLIHKNIPMNLENITLSESKRYQTQKNTDYKGTSLGSSTTGQSNLCYSKSGQWLPVRDWRFTGRRCAETVRGDGNEVYPD